MKGWKTFFVKLKGKDFSISWGVEANFKMSWSLLPIHIFPWKILSDLPIGKKFWDKINRNVFPIKLFQGFVWDSKLTFTCRNFKGEIKTGRDRKCGFFPTLDLIIFFSFKRRFQILSTLLKSHKFLGMPSKYLSQQSLTWAGREGPSGPAFIWLQEGGVRRWKGWSDFDLRKIISKEVQSFFGGNFMKLDEFYEFFPLSFSSKNWTIFFLK